jgi:murein DD-endopeptidase MepM/ murein hydrolase activator NlpD
MGSKWLTAAGVTFLYVVVPCQQSIAANAPDVPAQTSHSHTLQPKKRKPSTRRKRAAKAPSVATKRIPMKTPADIPEVTEAASVWKGCLESHGVPRLAMDLGVEQSRLDPLLTDLGLRAEEGAACVPYVAATGGEGGAVSAIFQRPEPRADEPAILEIRRKGDLITVTPEACDCPERARRVLDFPASDAAQGLNEIFETVPSNIRWQLDALIPQMVAKLALDQARTHLDAGSPDAASFESPAGAGAYTVRVALDRGGDDKERLQFVELLESASGKCVDGAWWLERPGAPGVLIGMEGVAYERLLWQSPVKYVHKSRGTGPAVTSFRRRVAAPKGSNAKATTRTYTVREYHLGSDLTAPKGTEVHGVGDAKVAFAGRMGGFGKLIILDHGMGYQTYYAHLSVIKPEIKVGVSVARGDVIGLVGSTGRSTAPHLHFETRKDAKYIDPFDNTRQLDYWLLTPEDQQRIEMNLLATHTVLAHNATAPDDGTQKAPKGDR